ncbi:MAG: phage tail assembly chaperone G [Paraclostridium sordellii]|uniref:Gp12 phage protein n=1 Tax=Paraclostridium sordellii TaxID=1505 RepID=A0ABM9RTL5_PARSO|nr:hypothetical protein [Paeniclostridium sordellii]MVO70829.1 hypothetical protein [Paeniclostridium sordellii]CEJ75432.1 gp12 phage protein (plasmid) [[Clostridium] sordellii] [Paeniclostridium sordellii]CEN67974.1 Gp12 protein [[Clostridium] sordellii] [Paeniclostridium sordellii]CEN71285.1 Gp12 protein [[Clostridium] sordellii] [Paeniclostridium sordellii]CEO20824.1 Gp12 protein [[Clostridium] sordellii] [Paeniclostridium sordellii]
MKIVVNSKEFDSGKMVRSKYKVYSKVRDELTGKENYDDEDLDKMVNALVVLFDNQFTEDDINDEFEVSDIIFNFIRADLEVAEKLNKSIDKTKALFMKDKK